MHKAPLELICPAGTPAALQIAVDSGADAVYLGFRDETNARNFPGLNFSRKELEAGLEYAHAKDCKIFVAINTYARAGATKIWERAVDDAAHIGVDAVILADVGLLQYCTEKHPDLRRHLSVQASASNAEAICFYHDRFDVKRIVLPRVLTVEEIAHLNKKIPVQTEVFAYGGLCVMAEGRCSLSSYVTGEAPNTCGVCSPASHVRYENRDDTLVSKLAGFTINTFRSDEAAGYPTLCKGRFVTHGNISYLFEEPTSLNVIGILDQLWDAGVTALKIEGRQRSKAYVGEAVSTFRKAVDALSQDDGGTGTAGLNAFAEGGANTTGSYEKQWQ